MDSIRHRDTRVREAIEGGAIRPTRGMIKFIHMGGAVSVTISPRNSS